MKLATVRGTTDYNNCVWSIAECIDNLELPGAYCNYLSDDPAALAKLLEES